MNANHFILRGYRIIDQFDEIDACAQFMYKGYQISMTTIGRSVGDCSKEVVIFLAPDFVKSIKQGFNTIQEAIEYIDSLVPVKVVIDASGGVIQSVMSDTPMSYIQLDYNLDEDDVNPRIIIDDNLAAAIKDDAEVLPDCVEAIFNNYIQITS